MTYQKIVKDAVAGCFAADEVADFRVQETAGWEDDQFIKVMIVLNENADAFDAKRAATFRRTLRAGLDKQDLDAFPVVSFRTADDDAEAA